MNSARPPLHFRAKGTFRLARTLCVRTLATAAGVTRIVSILGLDGVICIFGYGVRMGWHFEDFLLFEFGGLREGERRWKGPLIGRGCCFYVLYFLLWIGEHCCMGYHRLTPSRSIAKEDRKENKMRRMTRLTVETPLMSSHCAIR